MAKLKKTNEKENKNLKDLKHSLHDGILSDQIKDFILANGDRYNGYYVSYPKGNIFRHGHGEYISKDGQIYEAEWHLDNIIEHKRVKITYDDSTIYEGLLVNYKYHGQGEYTCTDSSIIDCNFTDNIPSGEITLKDPNKMLWKGFERDGRALLFPENNFFNDIPDTLGLFSFSNKLMRPITYDILCNESRDSFQSGSEYSIECEDDENEK